MILLPFGGLWELFKITPTFVNKKNKLTNVALSFGQFIRNIDFTEKQIDLALRAGSICFSVKLIFLMDRPHERGIFV
jgi:hypothetical protein